MTIVYEWRSPYTRCITRNIYRHAYSYMYVTKRYSGVILTGILWRRAGCTSGAVWRSVGSRVAYRPNIPSAARALVADRSVGRGQDNPQSLCRLDERIEHFPNKGITNISNLFMEWSINEKHIIILLYIVILEWKIRLPQWNLTQNISGL